MDHSDQQTDGPMPPSLWDKIDYSLVVAPVAVETKPEDVEAAQKQKRAWKRLRPILDALGTLFWVYVILQVFFVDVDAAILGRYAPYRFFLFAALALWLVLTVRRTWPILGTVAYLLGFPLVVLLWKIPKTLYRTGSPVAFLAAANVLTSIFGNIRRSVVVGVVVAFSCLAIAASHSRGFLGVAGTALALALVQALYRTIKTTVIPNRFLRAQQAAIRKALDAKVVRGLIEPGTELRSADIQKFNQGQQTALIQNLGNAVIGHRALNFWAYQLDRYRRSPASVLLNAMAYAWLLLRATIALAFLNLALYHADVHAFAYQHPPGFLTFTRYAIAGLYGGEIRALEPLTGLADGLSVASFVVGIVVLGSAIISSFLNFKASRDESEIREIIGQIQDESDRLDERVRESYEVSVPEAIRRLEDLKYGLMGVITALSTRIPGDFDRPGGA